MCILKNSKLPLLLYDTVRAVLDENVIPLSAYILKWPCTE